MAQEGFKRDFGWALYLGCDRRGQTTVDRNEPKLLQQRQHANGRVAEVYLQHDGRFYARETLTRGEIGRSLLFRDNVATLKLARTLADATAHPNCDGNCPPWTDHPSATDDPRCRAALQARRGK